MILPSSGPQTRDTTRCTFGNCDQFDTMATAFRGCHIFPLEAVEKDSQIALVHRSDANQVPDVVFQ